MLAKPISKGHPLRKIYQKKGEYGSGKTHILCSDRMFIVTKFEFLLNRTTVHFIVVLCVYSRFLNETLFQTFSVKGTNVFIFAVM